MFVKVVNIRGCFYIHIPKLIVEAQKIFNGSEFDLNVESFGRLTLERVQHVRMPPEGQTWTLTGAHNLTEATASANPQINDTVFKAEIPKKSRKK